MLKIIGALFTIISSTIIGYLIGEGFGMRVTQIKLIKMSLQMLDTEVTYTSTPLPEAFERIAAKSTPPVSKLFKTIGKNLGMKNYSTVGEAFIKSIDEIKDSLSLVKEDLDILISFGQSLGSSDSASQAKSFKLVIKELDEQEVKAEDSRNRNEKMYKNLGFLAGMAIVILLI